MNKMTNLNYIGNIGVKRGDYQEKGNLLKTGEMAITSNLGKFNNNSFRAIWNEHDGQYE
jgi:hypothetical protein